MDADRSWFLRVAIFIGTVVGLMWTIHIITWLTGWSLTHWGIVPRTADGISGIITMPFVHGDWQHLVSNSLPFAVLSVLLFMSYKRVAWFTFLIVYLVGGALLWLIGRGGTSHIGMSGVIYGMATFLAASGVLRGDTRSVLIAIVVVLLYGGMIFGVFPIQKGVSWEGHLSGAISGLIAAFLFRKIDLPVKEKPVDDGEERHFFDQHPVNYDE